MSMTAQDRANHALYESMPADQKHAVDVAFDEVKNIFNALGFATAYDDRAESLVAALACYLKESMRK